MRATTVYFVPILCFVLAGCRSVTVIDRSTCVDLEMVTVQIRSEPFRPKPRKGLRSYIATYDANGREAGRLMSMDAFVKRGTEQIELFYLDTYESPEALLASGNQYNFTVEVSKLKTLGGRRKSGFLRSINDLSGQEIWPLKEHKKLEQTPEPSG